MTLGNRRRIEQQVLDRVVDETLLRMTKRNLDEAAWWFRPYYGELVERLDRRSYFLISCITGSHEPKHAVRQLEPFLRSEKGDRLILVAALIHEFSYGLHPAARSILLRVDKADDLVSSALHPTDLLPSELDEAAREEARDTPEDWKKMTAEEKWRSLRGTWWYTRKDKEPSPPSP